MPRSAVGPMLATGAAWLLLVPGVLLGACNSLTGADELEIGGGSPPAGGTGGLTSSTSSSATTATTGEGGTGGSGGLGPSSCEGVTCSSLGTCVVNEAQQAECHCNDGFHDVGLQCVADESCEGVDCGRCSSCELAEGIASCTCPEGFAYQQGYGCAPSPNPCDGMDCGTDRACIPEHHCTAQAICVDTCDCSNCGDCDMADFADSGAWTLYCGGGESGPAATACTRPCADGAGCIPYATPICWGGQGCLSL